MISPLCFFIFLSSDVASFALWQNSQFARAVPHGAHSTPSLGSNRDPNRVARFSVPIGRSNRMEMAAIVMTQRHRSPASPDVRVTIAVP